jgi:hypothetical protein
MRALSYHDMNSVSGSGDVNWVQIGRDVAVNGATVAGTAFGIGLAGPFGPIIGVAFGAGVGALYDAVGNSGPSGS